MASWHCFWAGWISCGKEQADAILPSEEPEEIDPVGEEPYALLVFLK
jgi:hypothetical protein